MSKIIARFIILFLNAAPCIVYAQYSGDYDYSVEQVWGITKATNSGLIGGFMFKYATELKEDLFHGGSVEIVNIKHPQEQRYYSAASGNGYIPGKQHYLYSIRLSYLRERTLFKKASQQGVQVNAILAVGPTIGLEAPYYVEVAVRGGSIKVPYDPEQYQNSTILGTGNLFQGIGQSNVVIGLNTKAAIAFEFGSFKSNVIGLEVGFQSDWFTRQIIIIPTADNSSIFPSAYVTLFLGSRR
jgi:hypothetical protein